MPQEFASALEPWLPPNHVGFVTERCDEETAWALLRRELDAWAAAGRQATVWWRDDDAYRPLPTLERLLALSTDLDAPVALAVVPAWLGRDLANALDRHPCVSVVQHGWSHTNHAGGAGEKGACEVGLHRGRKAILEDLRKGRDVLEDAFAGCFQPVVTPPWNRIDPALFPDLALMGYRGISTFDARNDEPAAAGLVAQNCHCDPIDSKAGTGFRGTRRSLVQLTGHLADRREGRVDSDEATGFLTHHRDMDEQTWAFAERLIETIVRHPAARWADARELFLP